MLIDFPYFYIRERINMENFHSLNRLYFALEPMEDRYSFGYFYALQDLNLILKSHKKGDGIVNKFVDRCPNIETLILDGKFCHINLNSLVYLKSLTIRCNRNENFDLDLSKTICNQLEELKIISDYFD